MEAPSQQPHARLPPQDRDGPSFPQTLPAAPPVGKPATGCVVVEPTWCLGRCSSRCSGGGLGHLSQAPPAGDSPRLRVAAVHVPLHQRLRPRLCPAGAPPWVTVQGARSSRGLRCDPQGFPWPSSHTAWRPMALRGRQGAGCLACRQCGRPRRRLDSAVFCFLRILL